LIVVGAVIAAGLALTGCAPAGYNAADYQGGSAAEPAANAVDATPEPDEAEEDLAAEGDEAAEKDEAAGKEAKKETARKLDEDEITTELKATTVKRMGKAVVDQNGFVLYRFDDDKIKPKVESKCDGDCARVWPPVYTEDGEPQLEGVDPNDVGTVTRADGTKQLTIGKWPVYRYIGDKKAGQWLGQNIGGKWFVVNPDGTKNLTCLPKISKPVAPPADDEEDAEEGGGGADYSY
jgi:predicted lipoprotein with Yx(FWY)xxD motif